MDEALLRETVESHAQAIVDPMDVARVQSDLIEELHPQLPVIAQLLPQPVTSANVDEVSVHDEHADVRITYAGADKSLTIASRWEERGSDRPQIVQAVPQI